MKPRSAFFFLALCLSLPAASHAQVAPEKMESTFKVVDGLQIKLWASEPLFVNPTCMDIDHKGRVWVCESVNYRNKLHRRPKLTRPAGDRIVILEDTKGTGRADKATTFYQSPDLLAPLGIAVAKDPVGPGYKMFVCQSPDILVFTDSKGVGKADGPPKKLLSGFGGYDHDHGVHGILIGPDMKLYFSVGDTGVHGLQSSDKKGRVWRSNSTDCRAGTIWRCELDGTKLELIAHNFRNEYEPCVDSFGTVFVSDNDDDGNRQTRICYVMPGGNYGYHPRGRGESHWHEEQPGVVPKILRTYFGSPTGMCVYEGKLLPKKYWGQLLHTDAGPRQVRCYHLKPEGAGYAVAREDMVTSSDTWFRPSDICVAPDGAVLVADWYDPGVGGHGVGDWTRGRIYRIAPKGNKPSVPEVDLESAKGIIAALGSPALSVRYMAMAKIERDKHDQEVLKALFVAAGNPREDPWLRARAVWQYARIDKSGKFPLGFFPAIRLLLDKDPALRCLGLRVLKNILRLPPGDDFDVGMKGQKEPLRSVLRDPSAMVRGEAMLLLRDVRPSKARVALIELMKQYDGKDRFYLAAAGIAVGHHDKARRQAILGDFEKHFPEWNDKVAGLVWELRPPNMVPMLTKRLADTKLSTEQRVRIIDILAGSDEKDARKALLKVLATDAPAEVRESAVAHLKRLLPEKWRSLKDAEDFNRSITAMLDKAESRVGALALIAAAGKTEMVDAVSKLARSGDETDAVRRAAVQVLGQIPSRKAVEVLQELLAAKSAALRAEAVAALGQIARQPVYRAGSGTALKLLQDVACDGKHDLTLRQAAVRELSAPRAGAVWLLERHAEGKLDKALHAEAGRLLRASVYEDLRRKATVAFPPPGNLDPKRLPAISALATRKGNLARGKRLLADSVKSNLQCLKCHTVRGIGGQVGPDLSNIGKKASRENLFESILFPSKAIADQYLTWVVQTTRGLSLSGLIVEEGADHIVLRDAEGRDTRVAKKNIETRTKGAKSLMPDDLLAFLSEGDLVDMVEYLFSLKTPTLAVDSWHITGPFDNGTGMEGLDKVFPPEKGIDLKAVYNGKHGKVSWRRVKPGPDGYVDLQVFFGRRSDNIVSYLTRDVESPADQEATVLLGTDDGAKLWVNGKLVFTCRATRAAAPEQDTVPVRLKKGVNRIVLKINNGNGAHGFYLTVLAEQELKLTDKR
jgi:putative membrane-bound dehydrogenase-like protein